MVNLIRGYHMPLMCGHYHISIPTKERGCTNHVKSQVPAMTSFVFWQADESYSFKSWHKSEQERTVIDFFFPYCSFFLCVSKGAFFRLAFQSFEVLILSAQLYGLNKVFWEQTFFSINKLTLTVDNHYRIW